MVEKNSQLFSGVFTKEIQNKINQLKEEIIKEQQKINQIKAADPEKKIIFDEKFKEYVKIRGREFFYPYISSGRGNGVFAELLDGSVKYDLINGIGTNLLGHAHPLMVESNLEAALVDTVMCGNLQTYPDANETAKSIVNSVREKSRLRHFWFTGSGGCANDLALKLLWQKKAPNYNLIAFKRAFAGRTVATQDITDKPDFREGMPKLLNVFYAPHFDQKASSPAESIRQTIESLEEIWKSQKGEVCALMMELVQGEAGFIFGPREFYVAVFEWAKSKGIYIWIDEVQTFARTRELFCFQSFGLDAYVDIVTVAKALHVCGAIYTEELNPKAGLIAGTFNGSISSIKMARKSIQYLLDGGFYGNDGQFAKLEKSFLERFHKLSTGSCKGKLGYFGAIGTMVSFEVGDSSKKVTSDFAKLLFENGVIGFTAGSDPARVRFLLPLTLTNKQIDDIFSILEKTFLQFHF